MYPQPFDHETSAGSLAKKLGDFSSAYADVNGIRLHYVSGGSGEPLILLPGWPQTWWAFHKIMPGLAKDFQVIAVDIRGMGGSGRPADGYEKKNMALDIYELSRVLGFDKINIAGHDIGAHVAFSFAANFPGATAKLVMLDTPHPDESIYQLPMMPIAGRPFPWWLAFNQVDDLPEQLLAGHMELMQQQVFAAVAADPSAIDAFDRQVYAEAYSSTESIRSGNGWYKAFSQDIADMKTYGRLQMPVAGIGGSGFKLLQQSLPAVAINPQLFEVKESGHFIAEENPQAVLRLLLDFLKKK